MLQKLPVKKIKAKSPSIIEVDNGVTVHIDYDGNVSIEGHKKLTLKCDDDLELDAKNINIQAKEVVYVGSGKGTVMQSPILHLNPKHSASGYIKRKNKNAKGSQR